MKFPEKRRLIVLICLMLSVGFMLTSLASYYVSRNSIRQSIVDTELPLTSDNIYSEIQKDLIRPIFISSMMSSDTFLRDWVIGGERDREKIGQYLGEIKRRYGVFASFFISEKTRNYYYPGGILKKVDENLPLDAWYFRVRNMKKPYEINVDTDELNHDLLTIYVNFKVQDYAGNFIGATGVGLSVEAVQKLIASYQQRYQRNIYFVSREGKVLFLGRENRFAGQDIRQIEGLRDHAAAILQGSEGAYQYRSGGHHLLLNVRFIPELNWFLFVEKKEDQAISGIRHTLFMNLGISLLVTLVVLFFVNLTLNHYQRDLETMATTDKLTGLSNRQAFDILAPQAVSDARRSRTPLSLLLADIDHFKEVNDRYGHLAGDEIIAGVAAFFRQQSREADILCRWGGEEFLLLLKNCSEEQAGQMAEKLRRGLLETEFSTGQVTASFGVSEILPDENMDAAIGRADSALYGAKAQGRNRVVISPAPKQE